MVILSITTLAGGGGGLFLRFAVSYPYPDPGLLHQGGIGYEEGIYLHPYHFRAALAVLLNTCPNSSSHIA